MRKQNKVIDWTVRQVMSKKVSMSKGRNMDNIKAFFICLIALNLVIGSFVFWKWIASLV